MDVADVNVEQWLTYFLEYVHDYDNDYSRTQRYPSPITNPSPLFTIQARSV